MPVLSASMSCLSKDEGDDGIGPCTTLIDCHLSSTSACLQDAWSRSARCVPSSGNVPESVGGVGHGEGTEIGRSACLGAVQCQRGQELARPRSAAVAGHRQCGLAIMAPLEP
jgi:hypothetical protein